MNFTNFSQQNYFKTLICICLYIRLNNLVFKYYFLSFFATYLSLSLSLSQPKRPKQFHRDDKVEYHTNVVIATTPHHKPTHTTFETFSLSVGHCDFPSSFTSTPPQTHLQHQQNLHQIQKITLPKPFALSI